MTFGEPGILWLLLVIPPGLVAFFWWSWRKRQQLMGRFIAARLLPGLLAGVSPMRHKLRVGLLAGASAFVLAALARPQWGFTWQEVKQRGVDIVVAIDCSKSMLAEDITPNRLARAKLAALELMQRARTDRLGLVAFAGSAFLACPLTIDDAAFGQSVGALDVNTISQGGTAIASAIEIALTAFKEGDNHKLLVLMTDGEDHDPGAVAAAQAAANAGLRIYAIGLGTPEGELMRVRDAQGRVDYVRDEEGNVVKSRLNEQLLNEIAAASPGGLYLPLRGAQTINALYERGLAALPKSEHQEKLVKQFHQRFHWPLAAAILLLIAETLLPDRRRQNKPAAKMQPAKASPAAAVALVLALALPPSAVGASPGGALREYKAGNYDQALKDYEQLLKRKGDDPRLHFNAGTAAYRNGQYDDAARQFDQSLATPDLQLQESAYYNRGNSHFWLGEQSADAAQRKANWEKALKDFEFSMKLNPQDADAKFNHEFVKKRLEELKQQQQQQDKSQQDKSDQQDPDQRPQSESSKQDQEKQTPQQDQQQQPEPGQDQNRQREDQQNQRQSQQQNGEQSQQQQQGSPKEQPQQQPMAQAEEEKKAEQEKEAQALAAGQMTPEQARQLLDAQKGQEKMLSQKLQKPADPNRKFKDW